MLSNIRLTTFVLCAFALSDVALGRYQWLERDGHYVSLYPRRFGQEHPAVIDKLAQACGNGICATLAGAAITPLLAAQPECSQQDMADQIIDTAQQFDATTKANMIALAQEYRQAEKNTPPDFSTQPNGLRNSVFCQKAPKNPELNGLVQAQDPANDPTLFFDPAKQATVKKGSQANTSPFGGAAASNNNANANSSASSSSAVSSTSAAAATNVAATNNTSNTDSCPAQVTVTVTAAGAAATLATGATSTTATSTAAAGAIGNFGSCSIPQIEFATGFDNRKETSFQPVDKQSFNHGSAQNIDIITQFICDTLTNSCKADQTAKDTCQKARAAADTVTAKTGGQADAFNAVFGITTKFADVASVDDQGRVVAGTGNANAAASTNNNASTGAAATSSTSTTSTTSSASGVGNFGSCSVPQIEFAAGFDNRKETSFQPVDKQSFNHGSAQNIDIITQFICDTLTNSCNADQTAKDTCQKARAAADTVTAKTGGQADAFNAVFGINTKFADVAVIDNQGKVVSTGTVAAIANKASNSTASSNSTSNSTSTATSSSTNSTSSAVTSSNTNSTSTSSSATASSTTSTKTNTGKMSNTNNNGTKTTTKTTTGMKHNNGTTVNTGNNKTNGTTTTTMKHSNGNGTTTVVKHSNGTVTTTTTTMRHNNGTTTGTNNSTKNTGTKMTHNGNNNNGTTKSTTSSKTGTKTNNSGKMNHNNNSTTASTTSSSAAAASSSAASSSVSSSVAASSSDAAVSSSVASSSVASSAAASSSAVSSSAAASSSVAASSASSSAAAETTSSASASASSSAAEVTSSASASATSSSAAAATTTA